MIIKKTQKETGHKSGQIFWMRAIKVGVDELWKRGYDWIGK